MPSLWMGIFLLEKRVKSKDKKLPHWLAEEFCEKYIFGGGRGWRMKCATPPKIQAEA